MVPPVNEHNLDLWNEWRETMRPMSDLGEEVNIRLSKAACLVLFELLTTSDEQWRKSSPDDTSAQPMKLTASEHSERVALWWLEAALEKTLSEPFASNYADLVAESKRFLASRN